MKILMMLMSMLVLVCGCNGETSQVGPETLNLISKQKTTLPFSIVEFRPLIKCTINDEQALMIIDTGATGISIFQNSIEKLGINIIGTSKDQVHSATKSTHLNVGEEIIIAFNESPYVNIQNFLILPNMAFKDVDGIIGTAFWSTLDTTIDFKNNTITFGTE